MSKRIKDFMSSTAGGSPQQPMMITKPLVIMFEQDGKIVCHIHPRRNDTYEHYGLLICDLVRHVANAFKTDEENIWEWVEKERDNPTTNIEQIS